MRASRQTYVGRVIFPAKLIETQRPFLSFMLYIDNHLVGPNKERKSARISCNYTLPKNYERDEVALVLSKVYSKEDPDSGGLAGKQYKSVDVLVEGDERLAEVEGKPGAVYKNLDFCHVTIIDKTVKALYRQEYAKDSEGKSENIESEENHVERPTTTPVQTKTPKLPETKYKIGEIVSSHGKKYKFIGGTSSSAKSWELVNDSNDEELPFEIDNAPPVSAKSSVKSKSSLRNFIQEELDNESNLESSDDNPF